MQNRTLDGAPRWWKEAILYQVYLRSFQDSSGNGQGDLVGLTQKVEIFYQFLGVNSLWLSPIHPSPDFDHGYDVSNYREIHPQLGTMADFDQLIHKTQKQGLKVILDGVFNHCSAQHPWFQSAIQNPASPTRNFFHWHPNRQPPNNWASVMGGPAWTWSEQAQSSYLHTFLPEQPDLNWRNPKLVREILDTLRFWLDRGVSGFRLDVFNCYLKDAQRRSNPARTDWLGRLARPFWPYGGQRHLYDRDQPELADVLGQMRELVDQYDGVLLGETLDERFQYENASQWVGPSRLHLAFNFQLMHSAWGAPSMGRAIRQWCDALGSQGWPTWVLSNHDFVRHATRWGGKHREARMRLMAMMLLTLGGTPCLYQGEEIGMGQGQIPRKQIQDPSGKRFWPFFKGRDGCRTPMQWKNTPHAGFSTKTPWLPINPDFTTRNYEAQQQDADSLLHLYRRLIHLRKTHPVLSRGQMTLPKTPHSQILHWNRSHDGQKVEVHLNLSSKTQQWIGADKGTVLCSTHASNTQTSPPHPLRPHEGIVLLLDA